MITKTTWCSKSQEQLWHWKKCKSQKLQSSYNFFNKNSEADLVSLLRMWLWHQASNTQKKTSASAQGRSELGPAKHIWTCKETFGGRMLQTTPALLFGSHPKICIWATLHQNKKCICGTGPLTSSLSSSCTTLLWLHLVFFLFFSTRAFLFLLANLHSLFPP
jgi:hypothetical protein